MISYLTTIPVAFVVITVIVAIVVRKMPDIDDDDLIPIAILTPLFVLIWPMTLVIFIIWVILVKTKERSN